MTQPENGSTVLTTDTNVTAAADIESERAKCGFWFTEDISPGAKLNLSLTRILTSTQSKYQKIDVVETVYGKTLVTDGKTQSAEVDEFAYHESLVHPTLLRCALSFPSDGAADGLGSPRTVFIGGGGELATAREVLRHRSVKRVVMVDLDETLINVCRQHLPEWGGDTVDSDPRFELIVGDAHAYLLQCSEIFDAIIMDISDPIEAGPGIALYTREFYNHAKSLLSVPQGVFVTQAGVAEAVPSLQMQRSGGVDEPLCYAPIINTLAEVFECVVPYSVSIPSFGSDWGFVMAFNCGSDLGGDNNGGSDIGTTVREEFANIPKKIIDDIISKRIQGNNNGTSNDNDILRHYDGETHRTMFSLTKSLRKMLKDDKRIMTRDNPIFMY